MLAQQRRRVGSGEEGRRLCVAPGLELVAPPARRGGDVDGGDVDDGGHQPVGGGGGAPVETVSTS